MVRYTFYGRHITTDAVTTLERPALRLFLSFYHEEKLRDQHVRQITISVTLKRQKSDDFKKVKYELQKENNKSKINQIYTGETV